MWKINCLISVLCLFKNLSLIVKNSKYFQLSKYPLIIYYIIVYLSTYHLVSRWNIELIDEVKLNVEN